MSPRNVMQKIKEFFRSLAGKRFGRRDTLPVRRDWIIILAVFGIIILAIIVGDIYLYRTIDTEGSGGAATEIQNTQTLNQTAIKNTLNDWAARAKLFSAEKTSNNVPPDPSQ